MTIKTLQTTESGSITHIIHLADLHIRTGDIIKSRYNEYNEIFTKLHDELKSLECIKNKTAVIVICGDIFHVKNHLDSISIKLFNIFLTLIGSLAPIYIIQGNHDYRQDLIDCPDILTGFFHCNDKPNVTYIHDTGCYVIENTNIGIGVVSVKDTLIAGDTHKQVDDLPPFPCDFPSNVTTKIALFHGTVINAKFQNYNEATEGYPLEWFADYDIAMLGDIHLQQIGDYKGMKWGYSGSLIQQNIGEPLFNHGYLLWDLKDNSVTEHHIMNNYGTIYIKQFNGIWKTMVDRKYMDLKYMDLPSNLSIIIRGNNNHEDLKSLDNLLKSMNIMYKILKGALTNDLIEIDTDNENNDEICGLSNFNSKQTWIEYIETKLKSQSESQLESQLESSVDWKNWILNPETILIDESTTVNCVKSTVQSCNQEIIKEVKRLENSVDLNIKHNSLQLDYMEWKWLFCYADNCWIDFDNADKNVCVINGDNSYGKSSFFDIICLSLFGSNTTSRYNNKHSIGIICTQKPNDAPAETTIIFTINNSQYKLHRRYQAKNADKMEITEVTLYIIDNNKSNIIKSSTTAVNEWINDNIGSKDQFLLSCMLTQKSDKDFFSLKPAEQTLLLENALNIGSIKTFENLFRVAINKHKNIIRNTHDQRQDIESIDEAFDEKLRETTDKISTINNLIELLDEKLIPVNSIPVSQFNETDDIIKHNINRYSSLLNDLNEVEESRDQLIELRGETMAMMEKLNGKKFDGEYESKYDDELVELSHNIIENPSGNYDDYVTWLTRFNKIKDDIDIDYWLKMTINIEQNIDDMKSQLKSEIGKVNNDDNILRMDDDEFTKYYDDKQTERDNIIEKSIDLQLQLDENQPKLQDMKLKFNDRNMNIINNTMDLLEYRPSVSLETYNEWIEEHEELGKNYDNYKTEYDIIVKYNKLKSQIEQLSKDTEDLPFNPKCKACNAQPWKIKLNNLRSELNTINIGDYDVGIDNVNNLKKKIDRYCIIYKQLDDWLDGREKWHRYNEKVEQNRIKNEKLEKLNLLYTTLNDENEVLIRNLTANNKKMNSSNIMWKNLTYIRDNRKRWKETKTYITNHEIYLLVHEKEHWEQYIVQKKKYDEWIDKQNKALYFVTTNNLNNINKKLNIIDEKARYTVELNMWKSIQKYKPDFIKSSELKRELPDLISLKGELGAKKIQWEKQADENKLIDDFIVVMEGRKSALTIIMELFRGFKKWLYEEKIIPALINETNRIVDPIIDSDCYLNGNINDNAEMNWFIVDGKNISTVQTAGGFREFIFGLAIRIAMSYLGATSVMCNQLFIDEGFVSGSLENLERIPDFIRGLLTKYNSIFLVTHMDIIKSVTEKTVHIERIPDMRLSKICWGECRNLLLNRKVKNKVDTESNTNDYKITDEERNGLCAVILKTGKLCKTKAKKNERICSRHYCLMNK